MSSGDYTAIAPLYSLLEKIIYRNQLQQRRQHLLTLLTSPASHIALLGEGRGRLLGPIRAKFPQAQIYYVDACPKMLHLAQKAHPLDNNISWILADASSWKSPQPLDLVITAFFLDSFTDQSLIQLIANNKCNLAPHGQWAWVDFTPHPRNHLTLLYRFFGIITDLSTHNLPDIPKAFKSQTFKKLKADTSPCQKYICEVRSLA